MRKYGLCIAAMLFYLCPWVSAAPMNLMQASVPVADQSPASLDKVLPKALAQVLIKVSGNPSVMTLPTIINETGHMRDIVQSYDYATQLAPLTQQLSLVVNIVFDKTAITQLLTRAGQPVWGSDRPKTLVWLADNTSNGPSLITASDALHSPLASLLSTDANDRGLSVIFPLGDLDDQHLLSASSNLFNTEELQTLANRYGVRSILIGQVLPSEGGWQVQWKYLLDSAPVSWQDQASSLDSIASQAINRVSSTMVSQLAMDNPTGPMESLALNITGVSSLLQYQKIQSVIGTLAPVVHVSIDGVSGSDLKVTVEYSGDEQGLEQALASIKQLTRVASTSKTDHSVANSGMALTYQWHEV